MSLRTGVTAFAVVFCIPVTLVLALRPAEMMSSITPGSVSQPVATVNQQVIEGDAAPAFPTAQLVQTNTATAFKNNQVIDGKGSTLQNAYGSDRTSFTQGAGLGYYDPITVTGQYEVTLSDKTQAVYYTVGQPVYFWRVDSFQSQQPQLRTLRGVASSSATTGKITVTPGGPPLDGRLTGAKWFANAGVVGDVKAGVTKLTATGGVYAAGNWVLLTQGPEPFNEGRDEWHVVISVAGNQVTLDKSVQRDYSAAVLAVAQPVTNLTVKNLVVAAAPNPAAFEAIGFKYTNNGRLDALTVTGSLSLTGCAYCTVNNCTATNALTLNSTHDCIFVNCTFLTMRMEECCFGNQFINCTCTGSMGMSTPCDKIAYLNCSISGTNSFVGMTGNDCVIDGLTTAATTGAYLNGDRMTVRNVSGSGFVWPQSGIGFSLSNVNSPNVQLGRIQFMSRGVTMGTANTTIQKGNWTVLP